MIANTAASGKNALSITYLCESAGVSRSGFYAYMQNKKDPGSYLNQKEIQDQKDLDLILKAYRHRGYAKGRRGIRMQLLHKRIVMNEKKISRLMKKFNLVCSIRKANPYRRMMKALKTNNVAQNLLERNFESYGPGYVLLTDITYLFFSRARIKAYLSVIKDAFTKQVKAYVVSLSLEEDFVLETIEILFINHKDDIHTDALLHSDQGAHYTSYKFIELLKSKETRQSMSRKGNCWDNAPQESFFGHMKDEIGDLKKVETFEELKAVIDDYMDYYNTERYQYELAKLSPNEYAEYYKTGIYPLKEVIEEPAECIEKFKKVKENLDQLSSNVNEISSSKSSS